jgi:hypothetical protein
MEIDDDSKTDDKMEEDGYKRYMRLHAIVEDINSQPVSRTTEWYTEQNHLLHVYENHFKCGFIDLHPEITDSTFRANCARLDLLMNKLMKEFNNYHWFSLYDYMQFNKTMIQVADAVFAAVEMDEKDEDEFSNMFAGLSV